MRDGRTRLVPRARDLRSLQGSRDGQVDAQTTLSAVQKADRAGAGASARDRRQKRAGAARCAVSAMREGGDARDGDWAVGLSAGPEGPASGTPGLKTRPPT